MRHLLLSFLLLHTATWGDVIQSKDKAIVNSSKQEHNAQLPRQRADTDILLAHAPNGWLTVLGKETQNNPRTPITLTSTSIEPTTHKSTFHWRDDTRQDNRELPGASTLLLFIAGISLMLVARRVKQANRRRKAQALARK